MTKMSRDCWAEIGDMVASGNVAKRAEAAKAAYDYADEVRTENEVLWADNAALRRKLKEKTIPSTSF